MKPFKPLNVQEQKDAYLRKLAREFSRRLDHIKAADADRLAKAAECRKQADDLLAKVASIEDRVADRADVTHGGWDVWRHDEGLLRKVVAQMEEAAAPYRLRAQQARDRADQWEAPYKGTVAEASREYDALRRNLFLSK